MSEPGAQPAAMAAPDWLGGRAVALLAAGASISGLVAGCGFLIDIGRRQMLGVGGMSLDTGVLTEASLGLLFDMLGQANAQMGLVIAAVLGVLLLASNAGRIRDRLSRRPGHMQAAILAGLLLMSLTSAALISTLHLPAFQISGVLVGKLDSKSVAADENRGLVGRRAAALWDDIRCAKTVGSGQTSAEDCAHQRPEQHRSRLSKQVLGGTVVSVLALLACIGLVRWQPPAVTVQAQSMATQVAIATLRPMALMLALASFLLAPHSYGRLLASTEFPLASIRLKADMAESVGFACAGARWSGYVLSEDNNLLTLALQGAERDFIRVPRGHLLFVTYYQNVDLLGVRLRGAESAPNPCAPRGAGKPNS